MTAMWVCCSYSVFFKQKTASELRISDWSSDVCSPDLRAHSPIMLTHRSRYALRAMLYLAQTPAGGPPIAMHRIASHANVPRKFLELIQIGRASCRERVCQYV